MTRNMNWALDPRQSRRSSVVATQQQPAKVAKSRTPKTKEE